MLDQALGRLTNDLAIDMGTSTTLVLVRGRGIAVEEPTVVAIRRTGTGRQIVAVGAQAAGMLGRTPENIETVRPIEDGAILDFELAEAHLRHCVEQALGARPMRKPRAVVCVKQRLSETERRAIQDSVKAAGVREVHLVPSPMAAALGARLPLHDPAGSMVVDIGGGSTEVGIVSLGGLVSQTSAPVGGRAFDAAIAKWVEANHRILIGEQTAERVKIEAASAAPPRIEKQILVKGRDLETGVPREVAVRSSDLAQALQEPVQAIVEAMREALRPVPAELATDILDRGVVLCGGGALLAGMTSALRDLTGMPVLLAEDPTRCVVLGGGMLLEDADLLERVACP